MLQEAERLSSVRVETAKTEARRFRRAAAALAWLVMAVALGGCGAEAPFVWVEVRHLPQVDPKSEYIVQPGDTLSVRVYNDANFSTTSVVRTDGVISLPLTGEVDVRGKRPSEIAAQLEALLTKFMNSPSVSVTVDAVHLESVVVAGQVGAPGLKEVKPGTRLLELIAIAGGLTEFADDTRIFLVRRGSAERVRFTLKMLYQGNSVAASVQVGEGDLVIVE